MTYQEIICDVAAKHNMQSEFVDKVYKAYWKAIREHIKSLPLKANLSDDEFRKLRPNINIPSIGKLYVTLDRYQNTKTVKNYIIKKEK